MAVEFNNLLPDVFTSGAEIFPLVWHHQIVLPSVKFPLSTNNPAAVQAVEKALTSGDLIFLGNSVQGEEGTPPEHIFNVGTLCRVLQPKMPMDRSRAPGEFLAEGVGRALAVRFVEQGGVFSAVVRCPSQTPDDAEQVDALVKSFCRLVEELKSWGSRLAPFPGDPDGRVLDFADSDISDPSRLSDQAAFRIWLLNWVSVEDLRTPLSTFSAQRRLQWVIQQLKKKLEEMQLVELLRRRQAYLSRPEMVGQSPFLSRLRLADTFEDILLDVDVALEKRRIAAEVSVKYSLGERVSREERRGANDKIQKCNRKALKSRLRISTGPDKNTPSKKKGVKESAEKKRAKLNDRRRQLLRAAYKLFVEPTSPPPLDYALLGEEIGKSERTIARWIEDVGLHRKTFLDKARAFGAGQK